MTATVTRVTSDEGSHGCEWEITVERYPPSDTPTPTADRLPADVRAVLKDWLNRADPAPMYNPNDPEQCDACVAINGICPYHRGVNVGVGLAVDMLTKWAKEGD